MISNDAEEGENECSDCIRLSHYMSSSSKLTATQPLVISSEATLRGAGGGSFTHQQH